MRLERHRSLVGAVIAVLFTAAGGSIQAGATSRAVTHAERSSAAGAVRGATVHESKGQLWVRFGGVGACEGGPIRAGDRPRY